MTRLPVGTKVAVEGPYGTKIYEELRGEKLLLIAGGVGIGPVRSLLEDFDASAQPVVIYRARRAAEIVHYDELVDPRARRGTVGSSPSSDGPASSRTATRSTLHVMRAHGARRRRAHRGGVRLPADDQRGVPVPARVRHRRGRTSTSRGSGGERRWLRSDSCDRVAPAVVPGGAGGVLLYLLPSGADSDSSSSEDIRHRRPRRRRRRSAGGPRRPPPPSHGVQRQRAAGHPGRRRATSSSAPSRSRSPSTARRSRTSPRSPPPAAATRRTPTGRSPG